MTTEASEHGDDAGLDAVFRVLADRRRRLVVRVLAESTGGRTIEGLVAAIRDREAADGPEAIAIDLHHRHLPLLADVDAIDRVDGRIALTDRGRTVEAVRRATVEVVERPARRQSG